MLVNLTRHTLGGGMDIKHGGNVENQTRKSSMSVLINVRTLGKHISVINQNL